MILLSRSLVKLLVIGITLMACGSPVAAPARPPTGTVTEAIASRQPLEHMALATSRPPATTAAPPAASAAQQAALATSPPLPTAASALTSASPGTPPGAPTKQRAEQPAQAATPAPEAVAARVEQIMRGMTVEEKVGQLFVVFFTGPQLSPALKEMIDRYHVGGIILFGSVGNIRSVSQVAQLVNDAQREATSNRPGIPLLVAVDQEGGPVARLRQGVTVFPSNMAVGATGSTDDARRMAEITARELRALGINMNLAPVMDVNNNPDNPIIGIRSFGSSPETVAELGTAMIEAYRANGVLATAKHFPGHGDTSVDSHVGLPLIPHPLSHLESTELLPFQAAIDARVDAIMTAHVLVPALEPDVQLPATLSAKILQGVLRDQLGFTGLIATDSLGMGALDKTYGVTAAAGMAFQAGADVLLFGADQGHTPAEQQPAYRKVLELVKSGAVPESRLDDSVRRILSAKAHAGLLDWTPASLDDLPRQVGTREHLQVAAQIAQDSITLVKDDAGVLPVAKEEKVLLVWPEDAGNPDALQARHPSLEIVRISASPTAAEIAQATARAEEASLVVAGVLDARRSPSQVRLVDALAGRRLVVVALGVPYDLLAFPGVRTYLATYGTVPATLDALAEVISGEIKPRGHLPVELPGLYPAGHGLTEWTRTAD